MKAFASKRITGENIDTIWISVDKGKDRNSICLQSPSSAEQMHSPIRQSTAELVYKLPGGDVWIALALWSTFSDKEERVDKRDYRKNHPGPV